MRQAPPERKQLTVRLSTELYEQLQLVAGTVNRPMNKLVTAAIQDYLTTTSQQLAEEISPRLEKLRRYAEDPKNRRVALEALARDEARFASEDPAEGSRISEG